MRLGETTLSGIKILQINLSFWHARENFPAVLGIHSSSCKTDIYKLDTETKLINSAKECDEKL